MADQNELDDLRSRLSALPLDQQLHLFELVLGDYRRRHEEARAELRAAQREFHANESLRRAVAAPFAFPSEAKREAG